MYYMFCNISDNKMECGDPDMFFGDMFLSAWGNYLPDEA